MIISTGNLPATTLFPSLQLASWQDTYTVLHLWTQIVGKIRLALSPKINHWWQSTLYVTPRGLTTGTIPYQTRTFEIRFDFIESQLCIEASDGATQKIDLVTRSVSEFYDAVMAALKAVDIEVSIWTMPQEIENPILFDRDDRIFAYDPDSAHRFWQILVQVDRIMTIFRADFIGNPVRYIFSGVVSISLLLAFRDELHPNILAECQEWLTG